MEVESPRQHSPYDNAFSYLKDAKFKQYQLQMLGTISLVKFKVSPSLCIIRNCKIDSLFKRSIGKKA